MSSRFFASFLALWLVLPGLPGLTGFQATRDVPAPARRAIDGLTGFLVDSRVEDIVTHQSFQLETIHVFDERCRTRRFLVDRPALRDFEYRLGGALCTLRLGKPSLTADAVAARAMILRMELHRAVFLWPAGFEWIESEAKVREAVVTRTLGPPSEKGKAAESEPVGTLVAELDEAGRLRRMTAFTHDALEAESYTILERFEQDGRTWPRRLQLAFGGETRWNERVVEIQTRIKRSDLSFVPPDRRPAPPPGVRSMDLLSFTFRRVELDGSMGWEAAEAHYADLLAEASDQNPDLDLDPTPTFELGPDALPATCLIRLREVRSKPPEGWTTRPERSGLAIRGQKTPQAITPKQLEVLTASIPPGNAAGRPYVRLLSHQGLAYVDLYQPFEQR